MKIAINVKKSTESIKSSFGLSILMIEWIAKRKDIKHRLVSFGKEHCVLEDENHNVVFDPSADLPRTDKDLIFALENKKFPAAPFSKLKVIEIPDKAIWHIEKNIDGSEKVITRSA